jgi:hypothetical protein
MKRWLDRRGLLVWCALSGAAVAAAAEGPPVLFPEPMSERIVRYDIRVALDAEKKALAGEEVVTWKNTTGEEVGDAWFHLYLNAFANDRSVFMKESSGAHRGFKASEDQWGYCRVKTLALAGADGKETPLPLEYPGEDRTVARVTLPAPVPPGGEAAFRIVFEDKLPKVFARAGSVGDFVMAGQWFPKLGVYEAGRGWNCHPYHLNSEFFADFGVYDVAVTVPAHYVVGATGVQWEETPGDRTKTLRFHAEDVHDFAWTASPDFVEVTENFRGTTIRVLMQPGNRGDVARYAGAVKAALEGFERYLWKYPYPVITVVDPPRGGLGAGGMEYPTLITSMTHPFIPDGFYFPEMVTLHEFGHQYWYGMSANNEFEEAWLDEGINSYYEMRILDDWLGKETSLAGNLAGWRLGDGQSQRLGYISLPDADPVVLPSWKYANNQSYSVISYNKSTLVMAALEEHLGRARMDAAMKAFFARVKFTHPTTEDFLRIVSEEAGEDLRPFLEPLLFGTGVVDFDVLRVKSRLESPPKGLDLSKDPPSAYPKASGKRKKGGGEGAGQTSADKAGPGEETSPAPKPKDVWVSQVTIQRKGDLVLPVTVRVHFAEGKAVDARWDGQGRTHTFEFRGAKVTRVEVDPDGKVQLDRDRFNNGWTSKPDRRPAGTVTARLSFVFQGLFAFLAAAL